MIVRRYISQVVIPLFFICSLLFLLMLVQRLSSLSVWDDAYMFVRYADNLLQYGHLSWNPDHINVYGLTSPAYLMIVIPIRLLFPTEPALVMILSSLISGFLTVVTLTHLIFKQLVEVHHHYILLIVISLSIVVAGDTISLHLTSGMDTMFALWMMSVWISLLYTSNRFSLTGIVGGLFFIIRPELIVIPMMMIPFMLRFSASHSHLTRYISGFVITILIQITVAWIYFGYPLPLSFFAKNTSIYSQEFYGYYNHMAWGYFKEFLMAYLYLVLIVFIGMVARFRHWNWQDYGLLLGGGIVCIYHVVFVIPIMGFGGRFFYPLLPILVVLVSFNLPLIFKRLPTSFVKRILDYPLPFLFVPILLIPALINPTPIVVTLVQYTQPDQIPTIGAGQFDLNTAYDHLYFDNWYRLDDLSKLDDEVVIATTEIGLPGVMNPNKHIIDLAGLNQREFAFEGFDADWLMQTENQPDWIYMPFPHYEGMWFELFEHPIFQHDYDFFYAQSLGTSMDVAIRRNSPFYSDMLDILKDYE